MPTNYTGDQTGHTSREVVTVREPIDADPRNAATIAASIEDLADYVDLILHKAGMLDTAQTWALLQTFSNGISATTGTTNGDAITCVGNGNGDGLFATCPNPANASGASAVWGRLLKGGTSCAAVVGTCDEDNGSGLWGYGAGAATGAYLENADDGAGGIAYSPHGIGLSAQSDDGTALEGISTSGPGLEASGGTCGAELTGTGVNAPGVRLAGGANAAQMHLTAVAAHPSGRVNGDVWLKFAGDNSSGEATLWTRFSGVDVLIGGEVFVP